MVTLYPVCKVILFEVGHQFLRNYCLDYKMLKTQHTYTLKLSFIKIRAFPSQAFEFRHPRRVPHLFRLGVFFCFPFICKHGGRGEAGKETEVCFWWVHRDAKTEVPCLQTSPAPACPMHSSASANGKRGEGPGKSCSPDAIIIIIDGVHVRFWRVTFWMHIAVQGRLNIHPAFADIELSQHGHRTTALSFLSLQSTAFGIRKMIGWICPLVKPWKVQKIMKYNNPQGVMVLAVMYNEGDVMKPHFFKPKLFISSFQKKHRLGKIRKTRSGTGNLTASFLIEGCIFWTKVWSKINGNSVEFYHIQRGHLGNEPSSRGTSPKWKIR